MTQLQAEGRMPISFLRIAWMGPGEWVIHEILPGVQEWEIVPVEELLGRSPIRV